jgi:hypothetical protein
MNDFAARHAEFRIFSGVPALNWNHDNPVPRFVRTGEPIRTLTLNFRFASKAGGEKYPPSTHWGRKLHLRGLTKSSRVILSGIRRFAKSKINCRAIQMDLRSGWLKADRSQHFPRMNDFRDYSSLGYLARLPIDTLKIDK